MSDETLDRRSQKTRAALQQAFVALLFEHGYAALKIGDVAARANVGRSTFYEHYRTKHDLLRASIATRFAVLADLVRPDASGAPLIAMLQHFRAQQRVARVLLGWPTRPLLSQTLADMIALRLASLPPGTALLPPAVIARQIADAQLALVEIWVLGRPACDIQAVADGLRRSANGALWLD